MASPFPKTTSQAGAGQLVVELLPNNVSALSVISYQYPLKLISPSPSASQRSVLVFLLTYGGGLVGGDQVNLRISVQPNAKLSIVTQGHTKVFKSSSRDIVTSQNLDVNIEARAAVCLLPDPVQPFEGSVYSQNQIFRLADDSSLCLLDWVTCGRTARGENWDLSSWKGRNEIWLEGRNGASRLLVRDNVLLEEKDSSQAISMPLKSQMYGNSVFGTLILRGPLLEPLAEFLLKEFSILPRIGARDFRSEEVVESDGKIVRSEDEKWRALRLKQEKNDGILWSAAKVRGCTVIKFGSETVEGGRTWIGGLIKQEGSVGQSFGDECLMCIR